MPYKPSPKRGLFDLLKFFIVLSLFTLLVALNFYYPGFIPFTLIAVYMYGVHTGTKHAESERQLEAKREELKALEADYRAKASAPDNWK